MSSNLTVTLATDVYMTQYLSRSVPNIDQAIVVGIGYQLYYGRVREPRDLTAVSFTPTLSQCMIL